MPRRFSKPRFPFIIADIETVTADRNREASSNGEDRSQRDESLEEVLRLLQQIGERNELIDERITKLLKRMVVLESSLDELVERAETEQKEGDESDSAMRTLFAEILPVLDSLEQLRRAVMESGEEEWQRGVTMLFEKVLNILEARGFRMSASMADKFNPEYHESVGVNCNSHLPEGTITDVIESGWLYNDSVLRYAKVTVSKGKN